MIDLLIYFIYYPTTYSNHKEVYIFLRNDWCERENVRPDLILKMLRTNKIFQVQFDSQVKVQCGICSSQRYHYVLFKSIMYAELFYHTRMHKLVILVMLIFITGTIKLIQSRSQTDFLKNISEALRYKLESKKTAS